MSLKKTRNARQVFAFMVPITLVAFTIAYVTNQSLGLQLGQAETLDIVSKPTYISKRKKLNKLLFLIRVR